MLQVFGRILLPSFGFCDAVCSSVASTGGRKCDTGTEWVTKPPDASTSEQLEVVALSRGDTGSNSTNGLLEHVASSGEENSGKAGVAADEGSKMGAHIAFQPEKTDAGSKKLDGFKFFASKCYGCLVCRLASSQYPFLFSTSLN